MPDAENEVEMPDNLTQLWDLIGVAVPEDEDPGIVQVYTNLLEKHCMTCGSPLGATTMLCITAQGIVMGYCGGACYTDMQVIGWLEEQHDDLADRIKFRGGGADT